MERSSGSERDLSGFLARSGWNDVGSDVSKWDPMCLRGMCQHRTLDPVGSLTETLTDPYRVITHRSRAHLGSRAHLT